MFSWHAEVTGMLAVCVSNGFYYVDHKVNKAPRSGCGWHFYHFTTVRRACQKYALVMENRRNPEDKGIDVEVEERDCRMK